MSKKPTSSDVARLIPTQSGMRLCEPGTVVKTVSGSAGIFACAAAALGAQCGFVGPGRSQDPGLPAQGADPGPQAAEQSAPDPHAHHLQSLLKVNSERIVDISIFF